MKNGDVYKFEELFDFSNGLNADRTAFGSGVPFANTSEVIGNQSMNAHAMPGRIHVSSGVLARYALRFGDVLFNRSSETADEIALSCVYLDHSPAVFGGFIFRARPKGDRLDPHYAQYALRSFDVRRQLQTLGQGGIRSNVGQKDLKKIVLRVPLILEQLQVTAKLADIDSLIGTLGRLIAKKQAIKQGMMQQLLTGKTRLPGFTDDWGSSRLGDVATMGSGGTPSSKNLSYYGGGIPWASIADLTSGGKYLRTTEKSLSSSGIHASAARLYETDAVLYAMYASIGECSLAEGEMSSSQAILGIVPGEAMNREYLYYYLTFLKPKVREMGQQGTQSNLNASIVRAFEIPLPTIQEQEAIAEALADVDQSIEKTKCLLHRVQGLKQGMMQELLTGRTRLTNAESTT